MIKTTLYIILFYVLCSATSCISYKSFVNYEDAPYILETPQTISNLRPLQIQPNDIVQISISSLDPFALAPFISTGSGSESQQSSAIEYLVNNNGEINFPTLGKIKLAGLTVGEANIQIQEKLNPYFDDIPIVQLRIANFNVLVNGEVRSPGNVTVNNEKITIVEAITKAGDFSDYALRDSVLVIREKDGVRNFGYLDFTSVELFNSPYFYLQQNDVIYVKPNKYKTGSIRNEISSYIPWVSASVSIVALVLSITRN